MMTAASFRRFRNVLASYMLMLIMMAPMLSVRAQSGPTGTLSGTVSDQQGGVLRAGATLDDLRRQGTDVTERFFNVDALASPGDGFGDIGRNILRGPNQKRTDFSLSKTTAVVENVNLEFRWEVFNLFNNVNFANPSNDLQDLLDFGTISNTVGGPRVMQFGLKLRF